MMKKLRICISVPLILIGFCGCGSDSSQKVDSAEPGIAEASGTGKPKLTACYKGDEWTCEVEADIVTETNRLRTRSLKQSFESSFVVRLWSKQQAAADEISHDGFPAARKAALALEFPDAGWNFYAENVAMLQSNETDPAVIAKKFVTMWNGSAGHKANMLGNYTFIGVGVAKVGNAYYATQIFH